MDALYIRKALGGEGKVPIWIVFIATKV